MGQQHLILMTTLGVAAFSTIPACGDDDGPTNAAEAGTREHRDNRNDDAGATDEGASGDRAADNGGPGEDTPLVLQPPPPFEGNFAEPQGVQMRGGAERVCTFALAVDCDGDEDCPGNEVCCGLFDSASVSYESIECRPTCSSDDGFALCHPGDNCDGADLVCRGSTVLPFAFLSVCASASAAAGATTGREIDNAIVCGEEQCAAGSEHCCLGATRSARGFTTTPSTPYCAPLDADCGCDPPPTRADAAIPDTAIPDTAIPDAAIPDAAFSDAAIPDVQAPDGSMLDDEDAGQ